MKRMPNGGYTIIETMIFLLISSALLGSVTLMLSGRQERIRFTNSVNSFDQALKDTLNDVSTGFYPTNENFKCRVTGPVGSESITFPVGAAAAGTNNGCLFLGRATQLDPGTNFDTFTVVGAQIAGNLAGPQNLASAKAVLLDANGNPGIRASNKLEADLQIVKAVSLTDSSRTVKGLAMISQFSQVSSVDNKVIGNAGNITLYEVLDDFFANAGKPSPKMETADRGIMICLQQGGAGGNGRKAAIIIGGNDQQLTTETKIDEWPSGC